MECKIFASRHRDKLEAAINAWLQDHPVSPDSMRFEYHAVYMSDPDVHIVEHTVVLFYVPLRAI